MRSELHRAGFRYRVDRPVRAEGRIVARPDIVFGGAARVAVFIDGCFWHGCVAHGRRSFSRNGEYWSAKIDLNRARDARQNAALQALGWQVLRFWEHEPPEEIAAWVGLIVTLRRQRFAEEVVAQ